MTEPEPAAELYVLLRKAGVEPYTAQDLIDAHAAAIRTAAGQDQPLGAASTGTPTPKGPQREQARVAALLEAVADKAESFRGDWGVVANWLRSLAHDPEELRRMATEAQQAGHPQPATEEPTS